DPSKLMRLVARAASIAGGVVVLYSGSRGAAGQALIAAVILLLPQAKRPWLLLILAVVVGGAVMTLQSVLASEAAQRLTDVSFDTREDIWALAWSIIQEKPLIGHGWLSTILEDGRRSTFNLHSIYLQVIGEIGFLGFLVMMGCLAYIAARTIKAYVYTRHLPQERSLWYLATAVMLSLLARGVVEIGAITGSHSAAMMLAWGIGMVEVVIALAQQRHYAQAWWSAQAASMGQPLAAV
ncbi:MAG TPA: O-antigen ligase family protein, partial [Phycisphaeraceae bacterium]